MLNATLAMHRSVAEAGLLRNLYLGFRAGVLGGVGLGVVLTLILVITAPHYFTNWWRRLVLPVYVAAYGALGWGIVGAVVGVAAGLLSGKIRRIGRANRTRFYASITFFLVTAWTSAQYILWVVCRGTGGWPLVVGAGAAVIASLVLTVLVHPLWSTRPPRHLTKPWAPVLVWLLGLAVVVGSFTAVWSTEPRTMLSTCDSDDARRAKRGFPYESLGIGASARPSPYPRAAATPRGVVLVTVDTLRADRLSCYGYDQLTTPNLDSLADEATLFEHSFSSTSGTVPSVTAIFSGTDPVHVNAISQTADLSESVLTMTEILRHGGFSTSAVVCQYILIPERGFAQGFDEYVNIPIEHKAPEFVTNATLTRLDAMQDAERFFIWIHYFNPHTPYEPPADFIDAFERPVQWGPNRVTVYDYSTLGGLQIDSLGAPYRDCVENDGVPVPFLRAMYTAEVHNMDIEVGRIITHLRELGMWDDIAFIFTADHGESLGEHDIWARHIVNLDDSQVHVPLIIKWPGPPRTGTRPATLAASTDIAPTILSLCELDVPPTMTGKSLTPGSAARYIKPHKRPIVLQTAFGEGLTFFLNSHRFQYPSWALVYGGYKYIYHPNAALSELKHPLNYVNVWREVVCGHIKAPELYRVNQDASPAQNIIADKPDVARRMHTILLGRKEWRAFCNLEPAEKPELSEEQMEQLRALGYVQ